MEKRPIKRRRIKAMKSKYSLMNQRSMKAARKTANLPDRMLYAESTETEQSNVHGSVDFLNIQTTEELNFSLSPI